MHRCTSTQALTRAVKLLLPVLENDVGTSTEAFVGVHPLTLSSWLRLEQMGPLLRGYEFRVEAPPSAAPAAFPKFAGRERGPKRGREAR